MWGNSCAAALLCIALSGCAHIDIDPAGLAPFVINVALTHIDNYADVRDRYPRPGIPFLTVGNWRMNSAWRFTRVRDEDERRDYANSGASSAVPRVRLRLRRREFLLEFIWRF